MPRNIKNSKTLSSVFCFIKIIKVARNTCQRTTVISQIPAVKLEIIVPVEILLDKSRKTDFVFGVILRLKQRFTIPVGADQ